MSTSFALNLVAVGDRSGAVGMWDLEVGFGVEMLHGHTASITDVCFLGNLPLAAISDEDSMLCIWIMRPNLHHGTCIVKLDAKEAEIVSMAFDPKSKIIFAGDVQGNITFYDMSDVIAKANVQPVDVPPSDRMRVNAIRALQSRQVMLRGHLSQEERAQRDEDTRQRWAQIEIKALKKIYVSDTFVCSVGFIGDPPSLYVRSFSEHMTVWSIEDGSKQGTLGTLDLSRRSLQRIQWQFRMNTELHMAESDRSVKEILESLQEADMERQHHEFRRSMKEPMSNAETDFLLRQRQESLDNSFVDKSQRQSRIIEKAKMGPIRLPSLAEVNSVNAFKLAGSRKASRVSSAASDDGADDDDVTDLHRYSMMSQFSVRDSPSRPMSAMTQIGGFSRAGSTMLTSRSRRPSMGIAMLKNIGFLKQDGRGASRPGSRRSSIATGRRSHFGGGGLSRRSSYASQFDDLFRQESMFDLTEAIEEDDSDDSEMAPVFLTEFDLQRVVRKREPAAAFYDQNGMKRSESEGGLLLSHQRKQLRYGHRRQQDREMMWDKAADISLSPTRRLRGKDWINWNAVPRQREGAFVNDEVRDVLLNNRQLRLKNAVARATRLANAINQSSRA